VSSRVLNVLGLALVGIVGIAFLILTPRFAELDAVLELTIYMIMAILALSLALIWGYGGILCFGQSAFFGLGAYTSRCRRRSRHCSAISCFTGASATSISVSSR
jgi:ABC-type branched-subunit amino acid transport system permease subunit